MAENKSLWVNLALFVILNDRNCHYTCSLNMVASGGVLFGKRHNSERKACGSCACRGGKPALSFERLQTAQEFSS